MKKNSFLISIIIFALLFLICILYFVMKSKNSVFAETSVIHDEKFGGVYAKISIDEFNEKGFAFGDSLNVSFSTGYQIKDIPYYNGFYVDIGDALVLGYPGYDYIKIGINYGDDLWKIANLSENDSIKITINEKRKYIKIQNAMDIHYTDEQGELSDEVFANFRNVKVGNLKENVFYRSASPIDNSHNRAAVVDSLISKENVKYIIDLSDSIDDINTHINKNDFNSPYFLSLFKSNKVIALSMNMRFKEESFEKNLVKALKGIIDNDGPYLVHCVEGKDRTGYVSMIIEALAGASYQEIIDDYMLTYKNYYNITKENELEKYETIRQKNIDAMLQHISNSNELKSVDYAKAAEKYLEKTGMSKQEITELKNKLLTN